MNGIPPHRLAAVLIPVYRHGRDLRVVLVERGTHGMHGGQVALPGGKWEPGDASLLDTALRESAEEIGLAPSDVKVLATLEPVDARTTGFRVHPYLARVPANASYRPREGEIARVVTADVSWLADPARRRRRELRFPTWPDARATECVALGGGLVLWGLTLRVLDRVAPRLLAGEWTSDLAAGP